MAWFGFRDSRLKFACSVSHFDFCCGISSSSAMNTFCLKRDLYFCLMVGIQYGVFGCPGVGNLYYQKSRFASSSFK